ncbi:zinc ribbon domain-containing protein [Clostridium nigeriense]|uniref:zinc ribbon domain-containing protein n=1 Tax=Clostridium nigeriense TaxID=1805470 RepID=UPI003D353A0A
MDRNALRSNSKFRANGKTHIFAGLIKCGSCFGNYYAKQDKPNLDGFRPSLYVCSNRYNKNNCDQKTISEKYIYNFITTLIYNISTVSNKETLEYDTFTNLISKNLGVNNIKCEQLFDFLINKQYNFYSFNKNQTSKKDFNLDLKHKELEKYKRALKRLEEVYLFDEDSMSSKDYILKKKEIENNINTINEEIKSKSKNDEEIEIDPELLSVILNNIILKKIDNKNAINLINRDPLKEFFNYFIKEICILDKKIISITFKNGLNIGFSY